jgi:hypothetical protein
MRILQAHVSKSVQDFPFHQIYSLDDYNNNKEPSIFFGMYRYEDYCLYVDNDTRNCRVFWTGQDAITFDWENWMAPDHNVTAHPKVRDYLTKKNLSCTLVPPSTFLNEVKPQKLGKRIYAYCPNSFPIYHGKKIIDELRCAGYEITIGDGQWTQDQWRNTKADEFYNEAGIGLCLSEFAGGGTSIIEMGLRGIKVVTNVFNLPNCIPWRDAQDVANIIEREKSTIGIVNKRLARDVWNALDHEFKWLEI